MDQGFSGGNDSRELNKSEALNLQELNLLGYPKLPYRIQGKSKIKSGKISELIKSDSNFSDAKTDDSDADIIFNSKEMIETLVNVCNSLVKDVKMACFSNNSNSDEYDRVIFEKCNLQKKFNSLKVELEKNKDIISSENKKSRELMDEVEKLKGKIKILEREKLKIIHQSKLNEEILKHKNKVIENDLFELQKILYKKLNALDIKYLPRNFQMFNSKYPDLKKLWSEVKYSSITSKEIALKKAVCIFQENNEILMDENSTLKNLLFVILEEINKLAEYLSDKMNLSIAKFHTGDLNCIFLPEAELQLQKYKEYIQKFVRFFFKVFNCFDKMSFVVDDNLFVCLTDVMSEIKNIKQ